MRDRPIRVLHTIDGLGGGGSERWIWELVRLSDRQRVQHRVVPIHPDLGRFVYADRLREAGAFGRTRPASDHSPSAKKRSTAARGRRSAGISRQLSARVPAALRGALRALWRGSVVFPIATGRLIAEYARFSPDIIHAHTFHGLVAGLVLKRVTGRPLVYTVPSFFRHIAENGYGWALEMYVRHHSRVDRFITNYPSELYGIGVPPGKVLVVHGMADLSGLAKLADRREAVRCTYRARLNLKAGDFLAISVGRLDREKGYEYGLRALPNILRVFPEFHWVILGDGSLSASLVDLASELGVASRVHFMGFVENPLPWYLAADLYMRTSVLEGDNLSSVQAMAAAMPVAGFDTGSEAELITLVGHGLLAENRSSASLAEAVKQLLSRTDRLALGQRGAAYAAAYLSAERVIRSCETMYEEVVTSVPPHLSDHQKGRSHSGTRA